MPILAKQDRCTGCAACMNACPQKAISMLPDSEGFLQPTINQETCVECGLCEKTCPIVTSPANTNLNAPMTYALWHYEDRTKSSSGGAFSALARKVIAEGGVVYGAAWSPFPIVRHIEVSTIDDLEKLRGSKYLQSEIGNCYQLVKKQLVAGRRVLFSGTPCQVAGLKTFLRKEYSNLLLVDIACHGTPSNKVFATYLNKLEHKIGKVGGQGISAFEFRRREGWGFAPSYTTQEGKRNHIRGIDNLYMRAFDKAALFRKSCYQCPFACVPRIGDCTIADFWGIGCYGEKFDQDVMKGVSLVLVNNDHGAKAIQDIEGCFIQERHLDEALHKNHNIIAPSTLHPQRDAIIAAFLDTDKTLKDIDTRFHIVPHTLKDSISEWALQYGVYDFIKRIYNKIR